MSEATHTSATARQSMLAGFKKALQIRDLWLLSLSNGLFLTGFLSLTALLPITLEERGISNPGAMTSVMLLVSTLFTIVGGIVSDKFGRRKVFLILGAVVTGLCIPLLIVFKGPSLLLTLIVAGAFAGPLSPILLSAVLEIKGVGTALAGTSVGVIALIGTVGTFLGPIVTGMIMDAAGSSWPGFAFMGAAAVAGGLIVIPSRVK